MSYQTPNMLLTLPDVGETIGPTWAEELNAAIELIDSHSHSEDEGVQVTPAGLNINADLDFNSNDILAVNSIQLDDLDAAAALSHAVYVKDGDLWYKNTGGVAVQVTNGTTIAGTQGSITGLGDGGSSAVFSDLNEDFSWYFSGTKLAAQNVGDIRLFPFDGSAAYTFAITLKSPTALASNYSLTLPATAPAQNGVWSVSTAGAIQNGLHDGSVGSPSVYFSADTDLGFYRIGSDILGLSGIQRASDGSSTTPAYSFTTDPNLGVYRVSADKLGLAATQILASGNGPAATPSWSFVDDPDTGIYRHASDILGVSIGGTQRYVFTSAQIQSPSASAATPTYSFENDINTGVYSHAADILGIGLGGVQKYVFTGDQVQSPNGSATAPTYSFESDTNTGVYRAGTDALGVTAAGANVATFNTSGLTLPGGIESGGSGYIKWTVFVGSIAASGNDSITGPGTIILGFVGMSTVNGGSDYYPMEPKTTESTSNLIGWGTLGGSGDQLTLHNWDNNSTNSYRVIVFWQ